MEISQLGFCDISSPLHSQTTSLVDMTRLPADSKPQKTVRVKLVGNMERRDIEEQDGWIYRNHRKTCYRSEKLSCVKLSPQHWKVFEGGDKTRITIIYLHIKKPSLTEHTVLQFCLLIALVCELERRYVDHLPVFSLFFCIVIPLVRNIDYV